MPNDSPAVSEPPAEAAIAPVET
ncbi:MAG: hypothetical protein K0S65_572, partial [Labilithrix sp.]|nr:hypothetical protein [Labilithrix sp.]